LRGWRGWRMRAVARRGALRDLDDHVDVAARGVERDVVPRRDLLELAVVVVVELRGSS